MADLSEEEVMDNDIDPLAAIAQIRREEGVAEEDLPIVEEPASSQEDPIVEEGKDELDELETDKEDNADNTATAEVVDDSSDSSTVDADSTVDNELDETEEATVDKEEAPAPHKFTANGQEFEFTQEEMLDQFGVIFGQAMDYTQKTQKMAPYRKMISALETEGISTEQLNLAIDALKGNKQALQSMMDSNKIDPYDLTNEEGEDTAYTPPSYGKNETQLNIEEITTRISGDTEYQITVDVIDNQWDQDSRNALSSNPNMIAGLHNDIKTGVYDKVAPVAMKMKVLDGNTKSSLEYYMLAGDKVLSEEKQNSANAEKTVDDMNKVAQDADTEFEQASSEADKKRSASPTRTRADRKGVTDYLDDDDENFDAWYKNLEASN